MYFFISNLFVSTDGSLLGSSTAFFSDKKCVLSQG